MQTAQDISLQFLRNNDYEKPVCYSIRVISAPCLVLRS